jgi:predicted secreted Zn-dependent protease
LFTFMLINKGKMILLIQILIIHFFHSPAFHPNDNLNFSWKHDRKLVWSDFKGKPDKSNPASALTYSDIHIGASVINGKISVDVQNYFDVKLSWTKNKTSVQLLAHEQLHFDITELYTRIIRRRMNEIASEQTLKDGSFNKESSKLLQQWHDYQVKYDDETNHGVNIEKQKQWENLVQNQLKEIQ